MAKSKKLFFISLLSLIFAAGLFFLGGNALAEPDKEYRSGQVISINGKNYLIANNKEFAEIIEITSDNKLVQISEVHGPEKIEDLYAGQAMGKYFLIVATGQYLYRYDISDPSLPKIEFKRDLYAFKRGQFKIGSVSALAGDKEYLFGAGTNGVRSFSPDNLFYNKIYTFDKSYGVAADDNRLYVITENKGSVYNISSGAKIAEVDLENKDKMNRSPYFDNFGNAYFPTDRGLVKINIINQEKKTYFNPVSKTETYSYGVSALPGGGLYYVNGHGITALGKNFNKTDFLNSTKGKFGANSWAVGISAVKIGVREIVLVFNKSSVVILDKNLKVLSQYNYKKSYPENISFGLKIAPSINIASAGQKINLKLYGFWPNETVALTFGKNNYSIKVDNQGYASTDIIVPQQNFRQAVIQAIGNDSKFSYQFGFTVL